MPKISEEIKKLIYELNEQNVSNEIIADKLNISRSSVYNALKDGKKEQAETENSEKNKFIEKKLSEIFTYEDYTEETIVSLIFNLKRIAEISKSDLGQFIDDLEMIFDKYHKITENPVKLFNFIIDISNQLSLITDHIEPDKLILATDNFFNRETSMEEADEYLAETKAEKEELLINIKELWSEFQKRVENSKKEARSEIEEKTDLLLTNSKRDLKEYKEKIDNAQEKLKEITSTKNMMLQRIMQKINNDKLQESLKKIEDLQITIQKLTEKELMVKTENQELKKAIDKINHDTLSLIKAFEQVKEKNSLLEREIEQLTQEITLLERVNDQENIKTEIKNEELQPEKKTIS